MNFRKQDFYISDVEIDGVVSEVIRLKGAVAFDETIIAELKAEGVKKFKAETDIAVEEVDEE